MPTESEQEVNNTLVDMEETSSQLKPRGMTNENVGMPTEAGVTDVESEHQEVNSKLAELKQTRSQLKTKVTVAARRLEDALKHGTDEGNIVNFTSDLEHCMSNFVECHEEITDLVMNNEELKEKTVVNSLNLEEYYSMVQATYSGAMSKYNFRKTKALSCNKITELGNLNSSMCAARNRLKGCMTQLNRFCRNLEYCLTDSSTDKNEISTQIGDIDIASKNVLESLTKLGEVASSEEFDSKNDEVEGLLSKADWVKRESNKVLNRYKSLSNHNEQSQGLGHNDVRNTVINFSDQNTTLTSIQSASPSVLSHNAHPRVNTSSSMIVTPVDNVSVTSSSSLASGSMLHSAYPTTMLHNTVQNVYNDTFNTLTAPTPELPHSHRSFSENLPASYSSGSPSSTMSNSVPSYFNSTTQGVYCDALNAVTSTSSYNSINSARFPSVPAVTRGSNLNPNTDLNLKRFTLPEFSGLRKDWPEFKAVWRELAESYYNNKTALALELKRCLKGQALDRVKNVYVTRPQSYDIMWQKLSEFYDDISASLHSALDNLSKLKMVKEDDYAGLVALVDDVESTFSQLEELGHLELFTLREIDKIAELLPSSSRMMWMRTYYTLTNAEKVKPLKVFMQFLSTERSSVIRLAESGNKKSFQSKVHTVISKDSTVAKPSKSNCAVHTGEKVTHNTTNCRDFKNMTLSKRYEVLRENHACFKCFGNHRKDHCKAKIICNICKKKGHNTLLCRTNDNAMSVEKEKPPKLGTVSTSSNVANLSSTLSLYAIQSAVVVNSGKQANIFCDNGSNTSYITHKAANRLQAKRLDKYTLEITTMGNVCREYDTVLYEVKIRTTTGRVVAIQAFGIEQ